MLNFYLFKIHGVSEQDNPNKSLIFSEATVSFMYLLKANSHSSYPPFFIPEQ